MKRLFFLFLLAFSVTCQPDIAVAQTVANPYVPVQVIGSCTGCTSGDMSAAITSVPINVMDYPFLGIQFEWTGTPTGTLGVSVSNSGIAGTFRPLTLTGLTPSANQPAGSASGWWLDLQTNPQYVELTYTRSSGSGALSAYIGGKK